MSDRYEIATWRFEQIAPWFDRSLSRADRRAALRERTTRAVEWPQIKADKRRSRRKRKPIPRSTLSRWIRLYRSGGSPALMPKGPLRQGPLARSAEPAVGRPCHRSALRESLPLARPASALPRDPLRGLQDEPLHPAAAPQEPSAHEHARGKGIERLRGKRSKKTRDRYQASRPHECWQLDGKGPFSVRLESGERIRVHILSIIDDFSRFVLAALVATSEDTLAAIKTFTRAVTLFGLPDRMPFDQGSAFDSELFRHGLAPCGMCRDQVTRAASTATRSSDATPRPRVRPRGKIEAYHKVLERWFIDELPLQEVLDLDHLQALLDATIALMINSREHRELKTSPEKCLADRTSDRRLSEADLERAFHREVPARSDKKSGHVRLEGATYRVPRAFAGLTARFLVDPLEKAKAFLLTDSGQKIALPFAYTKPLPPPRRAELQRRGEGPLQLLLDLWRGTPRKNAEPGFGLPELFSEIGKLLDRTVPDSETEAIAILAFWRRLGPLARDLFERAKGALKTALVEHRETYALLTGETGTGKTALLRRLRSEIDRTSCRVLYFSEARHQKAAGLVRVIAKQLRGRTSLYHAVSFDAVVKAIAEDETRILLWVDEAHDLPEETLFQIRALAESDLDAPTHLQVLLAGLPKLRVVLQAYPQVWRRIAVREEITGLVFDEVDDFLRHHFATAQVARLCGDGKTLLFERARGLPGFLLPMFPSVLATTSTTKGKIDPSLVDDALQRWDLP